MEKIEKPITENANNNENSPLILAYLGDAVHTLFVRKYFLQTKKIETPKNLHNICCKFCSAKGQSEALDFLTQFFNEQETDIVRRARNSKNHNAPKNSNIEEYKKATSFEALLGYLFVNSKEKRLNELLLNYMEHKEIKW